MKLSLGTYVRDYSVAGGAVAYDADAQAYFNANTAITSSADKNAINTFYLGLKSVGIYTKIKAMYLPIWGSAASCKWNLVNPLDTDAAFRLTFSVGWAYSSSGITPTNAYAETFLTPSTALSLNSTHLSFYSRTDNNGSWDMGCYVASPSTRRLELLCKSSSTSFYGVNSSTESSISNTNGTGLYIANRTSSTIHQLIKNNTINSTTVSSVGLPTRTIFIGGGNLDGGNVYGSKQCAFASIGNGLTDTEATNFYNRVNTLMTYFGINV